MTRKGSRRLVAVAFVVFAVCVCVAGAAASGRVTLTGLGLSAKPHAGVVSNHVLSPTAWTTKAVSPTPPRCSAADTRRSASILVNDPATGEPLYIRFCGHARAVVYLNGKTYRINGGHCLPARSPKARTKRRLLKRINIGLITNEPAAPGRGIGLGRWATTRPGRINIDDSEIEVAGIRVAASGIVVVGKGLNGGWFSLYGRDGSGPTGPLVSGSWTCG